LTTLSCTAVDLIRPQLASGTCVDRLLPFLETDTVCFDDDFPWKPKTLKELLEVNVLTKDGTKKPLSSLSDDKVLGIYLSAHWCPPCRGFTPDLVATVSALREAGKAFNIIFVSSDKDQKSFEEYFSSMTSFLAIPHGDKRVQQLSSYFGVNGIPTLVTVDGATGKTINADARGSCSSDPEGKEFPWEPKPVTDFAEGADGINDTLSLCMMMEGCSAEVQLSALTALTPLAERAKMREEDILFFSATKDVGPVSQIRKLTNLGAAGDKPILLLIDIPDDGAYYVCNATEVTTSVIESFLVSYKACELERKQLA